MKAIAHAEQHTQPLNITNVLRVCADNSTDDTFITQPNQLVIYLLQEKPPFEGEYWPTSQQENADIGTWIGKSDPYTLL